MNYPYINMTSDEHAAYLAASQRALHDRSRAIDHAR